MYIKSSVPMAYVRSVPQLGAVPIVADLVGSVVGKVFKSLFGGKSAALKQGEAVTETIEATWSNRGKIGQYLPADLRVKYEAAASVLTGKLNAYIKSLTSGGKATEKIGQNAEKIFRKIAESYGELSTLIGFDLTRDLWAKEKPTTLPAAFVERLKAAMSKRSQPVAVSAVGPVMEAGFGSLSKSPLVWIGLAGLAVLLFTRPGRR
jgi:hypothetical protein